MDERLTYRFEGFTLDPAERLLLRDGKQVSLTPKCFSLLVVLVENSGHVLEKEELLEKVWPNQFVEESNLSFNISALRRALGENHDKHHFIETVPKKGFRFIAPVVEQKVEASPSFAEKPPAEDLTKTVIASPSGSGRWSNAFILKLAGATLLVGAVIVAGYKLWAKRQVRAEPALRTIAVLPFKPLSNDSRDESLEIGMTETLITKLGNVRQIVVRPLGSVRKYGDAKQDPIQAGRELSAEAVLDGSIQKANDRVRVSVRLMNVQTGVAIWADQFDEEFTDIFKVQDSISERVMQSLTVKLTGDENNRIVKRYTNSSEAYQLYLQGHYLWSRRTPENLLKSLERYERAIEKDPSFALAYIGMAETNLILLGSNQAPASEVIPKAISNVNKALELDPTLAEAHNTLAELKYQYEYDWVGAEKSFKQAIDLNPNAAFIHLAYGWFLMSLSRFEQAEVEMQTAQQLDPTSMVINRARGRLFYFSRQYDRAIEHYKKIIEVEPNVGTTHWSLARVYEMKQMYPEALEEDLKFGNEKMPAGLAEEFRKILTTSGYVAVIEKSVALMEEKAKHEYVAPSIIAAGYARMGKKDKAFMWLEKAYAEHVPLNQLKIDPMYDKLRDDARFKDLVRRINLNP